MLAGEEQAADRRRHHRLEGGPLAGAVAGVAAEREGEGRPVEAAGGAGELPASAGTTRLSAGMKRWHLVGRRAPPYIAIPSRPPPKMLTPAALPGRLRALSQDWLKGRSAIIAPRPHAR